MKVKDLVTKLRKYPDNMEVLVNGYEGGYDDIPRITEVTVKKEDSPDYIGEFEEEDFVKNNNPAFQAVVLERKSF